MEVTKILLGIPLFYLLSLVYARIRIGGIFISSLISFIKSMTKILLGIPLFSLLSFVYARIGIGAIVVSTLISFVKSMTKILLGVPLFSLLFLVYVRIRIRTEELRSEHPAGARYLSSNMQTTMTAQTKGTLVC